MLYHKKKLRQQLFHDRSSISLDEYQINSRKIALHLLHYVTTNKFSHVLLFMPFKNEPDLLSLTHDLEKHVTVSFPVVKDNKRIDFYRWESGSSLHKNKYGILEPTVDSSFLIEPNHRTLVCLPSLAIDFQGYRLGYGGGYYDRFLEKNPHVHTLGIVFSKYILNSIPKDPWDIEIKKVCTEKGIQQLS